MNTTPEKNKARFPVVGIGASAGGLRAIEELLRFLPDNTGMAYVIVQHLSPKYKSLMRDILVKHTRMPVVKAESGMAVEPDHIYLIPAGYNLTIRNYTLEIEAQAEDRVPPFVIDLFFHSLGNDIRENAIGIILSGTGTDGSQGIRTIKESGGIVIVQDPKSGEFDGMPISAIHTQLADFVLAPTQIAECLTDLSRHRIVLDDDDDAQIEDLDRRRLSHREEVMIGQILKLVQQHTGVDFSGYKRNPILRRLEKSMTSRQLKSLSEYYDQLVKTPAYRDDLYGELLIGVTDFFRDKQAYEMLRTYVLPEMLTDASEQREFRIWVCGCSTGEEVYSLAIMIRQYCEAHHLYPRIKFLATDIDDRALMVASKGIYPAQRLTHLDEELLDRYFTFDGTHYEVRKFIRDQIIFAHNDATSDPPFINLDMVSCRNLLIYLQPHVQKKLLQNFHFGLKPNAFLWLGPSENILDLQSHFVVVEDKWKIFRTQASRTGQRRFLNLRMPEQRKPYVHDYRRQAYEKPELGLSARPQGIYSKLLLQRYAPSCVIIDWDFNVLFLAGNVHQYLRLPSMEMSANLLDMVGIDTVVVLRNAWRHLRENPQQVLRFTDVPTTKGGITIDALLTVETLTVNPTDSVLQVTWYEDSLPEASDKPVVYHKSLVLDAPDSVATIQSLQEDVRFAQQEIQNVMEELETSNEELQASNEELLAANEELQSTNEELQSVNEELHTVNTELQTRNSELTEANATIDSLIRSTELGTLFLDRDLHIRLFTMRIRDFLPITEQDIGRPVGQFAFRIRYDTFVSDVQTVMQTGNSIQREIDNDQHRWFLVRITPFRQGTGDIQGAVITFLDVSEQRQALMEKLSAEARFRAVVDTLEASIGVVDLQGRYVFLNRSMDQHDVETMLGTSIFDYLDEGSRHVASEIFRQVVSYGQHGAFEAAYADAEGGIRWYAHNLAPVILNGVVEQVGIVRYDITERRRQLEAREQELHTLHQVMANNQLAFWIKDAELRYVYANNAFYAAHDHLPADVPGMTDAMLFEPQVARAMNEHDTLVLRTGKPMTIIETLWRHDGIEKSFLTTRFLISGASGSQQIACFMVDVTAYEETRQKLHQLNTELASQVQIQNQSLRLVKDEIQIFSRGIARDLQSPLVRVLNLVREAAAQTHDTEILDVLNKVRTQSDRMKQMVDDLLHYARIGTLPVSRTEIDPAMLIRRAVEAHAHLAAGQDIDLQLEDCPRLVSDPYLFGLIINNLVSNALKYSPQDAPVRISAGGSYDARTRTCTYWLRDEGAGFDASRLDEAFSVFGRLSTKDQEGTGMGLAIVKRAVEFLEGSIFVETAPGRGSTFAFTLPEATA
ncbi:MAG: hypothetical protein OHK0039_34510 [Bacteroidia bacterium]